MVSMDTLKQKPLLLLFLLLSALAIGWRYPQQGHVCIRGRCFQVELAVTPDARARGLMFRKHLNKDRGMLFIFEEEDIHPFWMKNTLIPLDILWINSRREIVFMSKKTQPCILDPCPVIQPDKKAKYVLELQGGISDTIGLIEGDKVSLDLRGAKDML
jgi:hypothetical protein